MDSCSGTGLVERVSWKVFVGRFRGRVLETGLAKQVFVFCCSVSWYGLVEGIRGRASWKDFVEGPRGRVSRNGGRETGLVKRSRETGVRLSLFGLVVRARGRDSRTGFVEGSRGRASWKGVGQRGSRNGSRKTGLEERPRGQLLRKGRDKVRGLGFLMCGSGSHSRFCCLSAPGALILRFLRGETKVVTKLGGSVS